MVDSVRIEGVIRENGRTTHVVINKVVHDVSRIIKNIEEDNAEYHTYEKGQMIEVHISQMDNGEKFLKTYSDDTIVNNLNELPIYQLKQKSLEELFDQ